MRWKASVSAPVDSVIRHSRVMIQSPDYLWPLWPLTLLSLNWIDQMRERASLQMAMLLLLLLLLIGPSFNGPLDLHTAPPSHSPFVCSVSCLECGIDTMLSSWVEYSNIPIFSCNWAVTRIEIGCRLPLDKEFGDSSSFQPLFFNNKYAKKLLRIF